MDDVVVRVLREFRTWAVVGLSSSPMRPSFGVARSLLSAGYTVVPVNPRESSVHGLPAFGSLREAASEFDIEVVDVFRRSEHVSEVVDEAIDIGARVVWLQLDVRDPEAEERARAAGLLVVVDRCPAIELPRLEALAP
jgi:predicted CoA-binding protein